MRNFEEDLRLSTNIDESQLDHTRQRVGCANLGNYLDQLSRPPSRNRAHSSEMHLVPGT